MNIVRRLFGRSKGVDPMKQHQFRSIDEVEAMGVWSGYGANQGPSQAATLALVADARRGRCRLPGCGKPPDDPIHA